MDDLQWMRELQEELWPPEQCREGGGRTRHGWVQIAVKARRELGAGEWARVKRAIAEHKLVVELGGTNMFGGVGVWVYEHPAAPGVEKADHLLTLTEEHVFGPSKPSGGNCSKEAFDEFAGLSATEQNMAWLKRYGLEPPKEMAHYCY